MEVVLEIIIERCAGLDVHQKTVVACVRWPGSSPQKRKSEVRTFDATTPGLLELHQWLTELDVTQVAMESTGVYWRPVHNILEASFELLLVNAKHAKQVPGRKTDVRDCEWLAQLLEHGLLSPSFIPPAPVRDLRELTRFRKVLIRERAQHANRLAKTLETANIKLGSVATDILGKSGRAMLDAIVSGQNDPGALAGLAQGLLRKKHDALIPALTNRVRDHHVFLIRQHLRMIDDLAAHIVEFDTKIAECMLPFADAAARLRTIPGVGERTAQVVLAEIGTDMSRFRTAGHLASWAKICPGNNESGGKRMSAGIGKGNNWLKVALVEAAWAASRKKGSYYGALFKRLKARRGSKRAIVAVAHSMLTAIWHLLSRSTDHQDLQADYFDHLNRDSLRKHHIKRLTQLGYSVTIEDAA